MQQKEKFVFMSVLLFMHSMLGAASSQSNEVSGAVFGDSLENCAMIRTVEVPGVLVNYDFVYAHNRQRHVKDYNDHSEFALGILSGTDSADVNTCRSALIKKLESVRTSEVAMSSLEANPFFTYKREIIHNVDVVKDFDLPTTHGRANVNYAIAFPQGPDMVCRPFVIMPYHLNYIFRLARDSDLYKNQERNTLLTRIYSHAEQLCSDAKKRYEPTHEAPIMVVDPKKLASLMLRDR